MLLYENEYTKYLLLIDEELNSIYIESGNYRWSPLFNCLFSFSDSFFSSLPKYFLIGTEAAVLNHKGLGMSWSTTCTHLLSYRTVPTHEKHVYFCALALLSVHFVESQAL